VRDLVERFLRCERPEGYAVLLNVNIPRDPPKGARVTRVGRHIYEEEVIPRRDPGGREYFWIGGRIIDYGEVEGSDRKAVDEGYVSVTPLALEPTLADHLGIAAFVAGPRPDSENRS
jgi:5'-nucleotidase